MNFPFYIARRYLFSKKSTNAINVITAISVIGMSVGTAALFLVLSVFNGFEDLLTDLMNSMNADLRIVPVEGKYFAAEEGLIAQIDALPGVLSVSRTMEETAMVEYNDNQDFCTLKGVDPNYNFTTTIDSAIIEGEFKLREEQNFFAVIGAGIANRINIDLNNPFTAMTVYMPKRTSRLMDKPFKTRFVYPIGKFSIKQDYDYQFIFCSIDFVADLVGKQGLVSAIEIDAVEGQLDQVKSAVARIAGDGFVVRDRFEQDAALFKLMNIEKWISYAISSLTLVIVSFNLIGSLWMIVLDKRRDISILKSMGAQNVSIRNIFLSEGILISTLGVLLGFFLALTFYVLQRQFGLIGVPEGFVVQAYPISVRWMDFLTVAITVLGIGLLASILPANKARLVSAFIREE